MMLAIDTALDTEDIEEEVEEEVDKILTANAGDTAATSTSSRQKGNSEAVLKCMELHKRYVCMQKLQY